MENRIQQKTHHNDRFVFAKFVNEETCYGRAKKCGEGQGQVDNCNLLHREANRLHVNCQVGQKGGSRAIHNEKCYFQHNQVGINSMALAELPETR